MDYEIQNSGLSDTRNIGLKEANGKYILFSDLNNIKDKDTTTFIIYDIKENRCIYKKDIQKHKNAVIQNINISEKYNGFIYSYFEEGIRKAYFYKF